MGAQNQTKKHVLQLFKGVRASSIKIATILAAILDFSESAMIQANHPRYSYTPDMSLTIYGTNFSGPLMFTETPSGTVLGLNLFQSLLMQCVFKLYVLVRGMSGHPH